MPPNNFAPVTTCHGMGMRVPTDDRQVGKPALRDVASALGHEWRGGLLVYRGHQIKKLAGPKIRAIPAYRLFT